MEPQGVIRVPVRVLDPNWLTDTALCPGGGREARRCAGPFFASGLTLEEVQLVELVFVSGC